MPLVGQLHRLTWGGRHYVTETWSCGLHFIMPEPGVPADPEAFLGALSQWMTRPGTNMPAASFLDFIKFNRVKPEDGEFFDPTTSHTFFLPAPVAGPYMAMLPQACLAVSTKTAATRGFASKGRFFVPFGGLVAIGDDGRISSGNAQLMADSAAQLITDINGSFEGECYVWSQAGQIQREIEGVRVGRVIDTQQRRRRNLVEDYVSAPIA